MAIPSDIPVVSPAVTLCPLNGPFARFITRVSAIALLTISLSSNALAAPVDVNSADAQSLSDALTGIGPAIAGAIVDYRKEHGPFTDVDDLLNVKGVGPKTLERNRKDIIIDGQASKTATE